MVRSDRSTRRGIEVGLSWTVIQSEKIGIFARRANRHTVSRASQEIRRGLERTVRAGAQRTFFETDQVGQQPVPATLRPDLDRLTGHRAGILVDEPAGNCAGGLQLDGDHRRLGASARLLHKQEVLRPNQIRRDSDGNELVVRRQVADRCRAIGPGTGREPIPQGFWNLGGPAAEGVENPERHPRAVDRPAIRPLDLHGSRAWILQHQARGGL